MTAASILKNPALREHGSRADVLLQRASIVMREVSDAVGLDRAAEFWLSAMNPLWSVKTQRARVDALIDESPDTRTFVLRPGPFFKPYVAGQFVTLSLEIDGVRHRRSYSISSAPSDASAFTITVRRHNGGLVSSHLHSHVAVGDVLEISQPMGSFILPPLRDEPVLFVAGGSGITAIMSQLRFLASRGELTDAVLVYYERAGRERIFADALAELTRQNPGFCVVACDTGAGARHGRLELQALAELLPDFAVRTTFVCGPPTLVEAAEQIWSRFADPSRLFVERFASAARVPARGSDVAERDEAAAVRLIASNTSGTTIPNETLLAFAERSGLRPAAGCRMGICHTCTCKKTAGTVRDLRTGQLSGSGEENIQICVSVAVGDVDVEL